MKRDEFIKQSALGLAAISTLGLTGFVSDSSEKQIITDLKPPIKLSIEPLELIDVPDHIVDPYLSEKTKVWYHNHIKGGESDPFQPMIRQYVYFTVGFKSTELINKIDFKTPKKTMKSFFDRLNHLTDIGVYGKSTSCKLSLVRLAQPDPLEYPYYAMFIYAEPSERTVHESKEAGFGHVGLYLKQKNYFGDAVL